MLRITALGGFKEVGRQAMLVEAGRNRFVFDYGLNVQNMSVPLQPPPDLDSVFLSHSHLDHSGCLPLLYKNGYQKDVYSTGVSHELSELLILDSRKVQELKGMEPLYSYQDAELLQRHSKAMEFRKPLDMSGSRITLFDAGHIPGSSSIMLEDGEKRILYSGDIGLKDSFLMRKADTSYKDIDVLLCESTYWNREHPDRHELAEQLRSHVEGVVNGGGIALLPCFAVGRVQEMLCILHELGLPIYMDGMGIKSTKIMLGHRDSVRDYHLLKKAFSSARKIGKSSQRMRAASRPCIIIASAGMMQGGPIRFYMKRLWKRDDCSLILNGFQMEGTPGRTLLDTGRYTDEGIDVRPRLQVRFMDFSAHAGRTELLEWIKKISPGKIIPLHSDTIDSFVKELKEKGFDAASVGNGENMEV
ncbi:MAG: MBL fold metallo-hydrolase [Candidatus Aenigmarchaeota archaeon]|nr:MBL fold metallo-hydrolase [Candidatus Aenigmarchaeota archaeon]